MLKSRLQGFIHTETVFSGRYQVSTFCDVVKLRDVFQHLCSTGVLCCATIVFPSNHVRKWSQVAGFRMGDKDAAKRADDLLDAYVHGVALALGDQKQF